jgi:4-hydroxythreonine-4-phosphate dehydrogenase
MTKEIHYKPILAITMGDPAGIGPEIAANAFGRKELYDVCNPILIGHKRSMMAAIGLLGNKLKLNTINKTSKACFEFGTIDLIEVAEEIINEIEYGKITAPAGDIAFRAVTLAIELALNKEVDATVTGPIQ